MWILLLLLRAIFQSHLTDIRRVLTTLMSLEDNVLQREISNGRGKLYDDKCVTRGCFGNLLLRPNKFSLLINLDPRF